MIIVVLLAIILGVSLAIYLPLKEEGGGQTGVPASDGNNSPSPGDGSGGVSPSIFQEFESWSSEAGGWEGLETTLYQAEISDEGIVIEDGKTFGHFGIRLSKPGFEEMVVAIDMPSSELSGAEVHWGTGSFDKKDAIGRFRFGDNLKDKRTVKLEDGKNKIDLGDMNWGEIAAVKIRIERSGIETESPVIKRIILH